VVAERSSPVEAAYAQSNLGPAPISLYNEGPAPNSTGGESTDPEQPTGGGQSPSFGFNSRNARAAAAPAKETSAP
jgi:hypothetical protein